MRANVRLLFAAGHETTVNLIGNGFLSLLRHPVQWQLLRDDPSLIPNAIEEILRFESPVQAVARTVAEPIELSGITLEPLTIVVALIGAANRDPAAFENSGRFDITRKDIRPLSFGGGIHFCLGAQLARIEAAVVFETGCAPIAGPSAGDAGPTEMAVQLHLARPDRTAGGLGISYFTTTWPCMNGCRPQI